MQMKDEQLTRGNPLKLTDPYKGALVKILNQTNPDRCIHAWRPNTHALLRSPTLIGVIWRRAKQHQDDSEDSEGSICQETRPFVYPFDDNDMCERMHGPTIILKSHMSLNVKTLKHVPTMAPPSVTPSCFLSSCCLSLIRYALQVIKTAQSTHLSQNHITFANSSGFSVVFSVASVDAKATMIKTLSPYSAAKTAEIMSRYRPIAPKPEALLGTESSESSKIRQSPYLRNLWPQFQARPTRTRKRGRGAISPPTIKRSRTDIFGFSSPPCHVTSSPAKNLSLQGFAHGVPQLTLPSHLASLDNPATGTATSTTNLVTLPLLPCTPVVSRQTTVLELNNCVETFGGIRVIDLNKVVEIPEEKDLLLQLQAPPSPCISSNVISPQPVRLICSSIKVGCINEDPNLTPVVKVIPKKPEEVEEEVESEALPAIISDSHNKVRMANSAYKEMVGQPECLWLDSMVSNGSCKRICGEVMLNFPDSSGIPNNNNSANGFSCWVRIEWGSSDGKKNSVNAFCDVIKLSCESKDYLFTWRFHPHINGDQASQSSCPA